MPRCRPDMPSSAVFGCHTLARIRFGRFSEMYRPFSGALHCIGAGCREDSRTEAAAGLDTGIIICRNDAMRYVKMLIMNYGIR